MRLRSKSHDSEPEFTIGVTGENFIHRGYVEQQRASSLPRHHQSLLGRNGEQVTMRQALLAFRRVRGSHSGERLARIIFQICEHAGILGKVPIFV